MFYQAFIDEFNKLGGTPFLKQKRPSKVKDIYSALKREHPGMAAGKKARIAAKFGKPGVQHPGKPWTAPASGR